MDEAHTMDYQHHVAQLPRVFGGTLSTALLKQSAEDFIVNEQLSFEPTGTGEHAYLYIQKKNLNTEDVAKRLARFANVTRRSVSFAGMKDRNALTQQWFSVHLPGLSDPNWQELTDQDLTIKKTTRHLRKLKRGAIKLNSFDISLRDVCVDKAELQKRIREVTRTGIPNYFMEQRFGYKANNLSLAHSIFAKNKKIKDRNKKGLLLSAVRGYLFNEVLSKRIKQGDWNKPLEGDAFVLDGTRNFFSGEAITGEIKKRLMDKDIHPSGPLFGAGHCAVLAQALLLEEQVMALNTVFCKGLMAEKVELSRRSLRLAIPKIGLEMPENNRVRLTFDLPSGSYATAVIRELFTCNQ